MARFNTRKEQPTHWELEVHACRDFLERMRHKRPGNLAIFSGRNRGKIQGILATVEAGINVLADKPLIIRREDLPVREAALNAADERGRAIPWFSTSRSRENRRPTVPVADIAAALERRIAALQPGYPGVGLAKLGRGWRVTVPDQLRIGYEAHFAQLTRLFLYRYPDDNTRFISGRTLRRLVRRD